MYSQMLLEIAIDLGDAGEMMELENCEPTC